MRDVDPIQYVVLLAHANLSLNDTPIGSAVFAQLTNTYICPTETYTNAQTHKPRYFVTYVAIGRIYGQRAGNAA